MKIKTWEIGLATGLAAATVAVLLNSCVTIPKGAKAVRPFDQHRYLGTWYEIARMDFKFEKNLSDVSATYSLNADGTIRVDNKGYNYVQQKWKESIGKAKPAEDAGTGRLKVSFFGPFYAGYNVIAVDPDYRYALVAGNKLNYLWLLSREKSITPAIQSAYLKQAQGLGYDFSKLVWTKHEH
ncbi:lipocalin family protein [Mucilaginibacter aquaedulcis]|uniref:lipocalin family protein n=1 Tax=Mucilaginibacter aquaedulcis TaxID=1187081 RepID=UPI0025B306AE|nr:lipocalin family protein [Mucilaginibacter aquaedulcis]MDN3551227.1 lipocalin family protein [Mucilaginibacter aquaedulcis]